MPTPDQLSQSSSAAFLDTTAISTGTVAATAPNGLGQSPTEGALPPLDAAAGRVGKTAKSRTRTPSESEPTATTIAKPSKFRLADFRTEQNPKETGIASTCPALPMMKLSGVKDFFILHPNDAYWSHEVAIIPVPTKGSKEMTLHLILDPIVKKYSDKLQGRVSYCQIVLGAKPDNVFFLGLLPTRNPDNSFNASTHRAAAQAKSGIWTTVTSRKSEGHDDYFVGKAENNDAFLETQWLTYSLDEIVEVTVGNKFIMTDDHPSLDRLLGRLTKLSV
jgi:hypothetical protein